jgi:hypothetical protein
MYINRFALRIKASFRASAEMHRVVAIRSLTGGIGLAGSFILRCMSDARRERLAKFVAWLHARVTGDEKGQSPIFPGPAAVSLRETVTSHGARGLHLAKLLEAIYETTTLNFGG